MLLLRGISRYPDLYSILRTKVQTNKQTKRETQPACTPHYWQKEVNMRNVLIHSFMKTERECVLVLPLTFPCSDPAIIHVVLLPGVVDKFPIVASIFLHQTKFHVIKMCLFQKNTTSFPDFQSDQMTWRNSSETNGTFLNFYYLQSCTCLVHEAKDSLHIRTAGSDAGKGSSYPHNNSSTVRVVKSSDPTELIHMDAIEAFQKLPFTFFITAYRWKEAQSGEEMEKNI